MYTRTIVVCDLYVLSQNYKSKKKKRGNELGIEFHNRKKISLYLWR